VRVISFLPFRNCGNRHGLVQVWYNKNTVDKYRRRFVFVSVSVIVKNDSLKDEAATCPLLVALDNIDAAYPSQSQGGIYLVLKRAIPGTDNPLAILESFDELAQKLGAAGQPRKSLARDHQRGAHRPGP
jgi:hypothetical protein